VEQDFVAKERGKRSLNVLYLGMTRVEKYDLVHGTEMNAARRLKMVEGEVREEVDPSNMNPLR